MLKLYQYHLLKDEEGNQKTDKDGNPIYEIKDVKIISLDIV